MPAAPLDATDGRMLRRQRSYDTVVDAILDLLQEGHPRPTAQAVSERSGVSMRSIFRLFDDVESLHAAAVARQVERLTPLLVPLAADGPLADRLEALVANRARRLRRHRAGAPVRGVGVVELAGDRARELDRSRRFFRAQVRTVFHPELDRLAPAERDDVLDALAAAAGWETWDLLRDRQGLSRARSQRIMTRLLAGALGSSD